MQPLVAPQVLQLREDIRAQLPHLANLRQGSHASVLADQRSDDALDLLDFIHRVLPVAAVGHV